MLRRQVLWMALAAAIAVRCTPAPGRTVDAAPARSRYDGVFRLMATRYQIPDWRLLKAIAVVESNLRPWTVNLDGHPVVAPSKSALLRFLARVVAYPWGWRDGMEVRFFRTREAALRFRARRGGGLVSRLDHENMDVGLMQISWRHHGREVPTLRRLLDPDYNVAYGASHLRSLAARLGSWEEAVGAYHAGTSTSPQRLARAARYRRRVFDVWRRLRGRG